MSEEIIRVSGLVKRFGGVTALNNVDLSIRRGDVVVIVGPSGSGKSTLLRSLNLLETPTEGTIIVDGVDITAKGINIDLHRRKMGMVFQHFHLFPHLTILENLTIAPKQVLGQKAEECEPYARRLLARVGLEDRADAYPAQLSGGQKQRIAIVRALCMKPEVMLFDEPTSALDPISTSKIEDLMDELGVDDADEIIGSDTSSEEYYRELSEQEVSAYPDGCNGYGHFDVTDEDMGALIEAWTRTEYGRDISGDDSSSEDNYIYTYDGETTSYLQKTTYYNVDGEYNDYVIIYSDSATGKIHSVTASMEDTERIKSFLQMVVQKLDSKADWSGKELERQCDNFLKQMDSGDGSVDIDNMVINGSKYSDGEIWLSIGCTDF